MAKKKKILIVEDDKKFGESLLKVLNAEGFECFHAEKPQTAIALCKVHTFDIAVIDCMLPQMNGVDLALKIKEASGPALVLYLMSGIYKDRNFSVSALKKTGAKSFLIKPFEFPELLKQLKSDFVEDATEVPLSDDPLKNLMMIENLTQQNVISAFNEKKSLSGFEIPQVVAIAIAFKLTGRLQLRNTNRAIDLYFGPEGLYLSPTNISSENLRSFLSSREWVYLEDLLKVKDEQLSLKYLCEHNIMSPHFADQAMREFATDELTGSVNMQKYAMDYFNEPLPEGVSPLQKTEVDELLQSWISHLLNPVWIKNQYASYQSHLLKKQNSTQNNIQFFPLVATNKHMVALMMENKNLTEIIAESGIPEDTAIRVLHLMMVYREFTISVKKVVTNAKAQVDRLRNLLKSFENQDAFEKLGLTNSASDQEIKKAYQEFSYTLHPDKLVDAAEEVKQLSTKVYEQIQDAYGSLKTPEKRQSYLKFLEGKKMQSQMDANRQTDQAMMLLLRGDLTTAEQSLNEAARLAPNLPRLKILQAWHGLKSNKMTHANAGKLLQMLPNEERDSAIFHYVKGLQNMAAGEKDKAVISFKNAITKDSNFLPARRELSQMPQDKKSTNILNADIKDVVGLFFKKK